MLVISVIYGHAGKGVPAAKSRVQVSREKGGSVDLVKKASTQNSDADIIATADYHNIKDFLYEKSVDWYGIFATTSMVLAYTDDSRHSDSITSDNWYEILSYPGVRIMGGYPDVDPGVYRRIMIEKLAEKFYGRPGTCEKDRIERYGAGQRFSRYTSGKKRPNRLHVHV